jgi:hypothetical protein
MWHSPTSTAKALAKAETYQRLNYQRDSPLGKVQRICWVGIAMESHFDDNG